MTLFLECTPDETLAVALGVPRCAIVHSHGKGRVSKYLKTNSSVIGLVDEDPGSVEPTTLSRFVEISSNQDVKLRLDREQHNTLVVICPRLEPWLIKTAKAVNVKMDVFNLSEKLEDLDAEINYRLPNLNRLLQKLIESNSPRLLYLKSLLSDRKS